MRLRESRRWQEILLALRLAAPDAKMIEIKMGAFPGNDVANKVDLCVNREPIPVIPPLLPSGAVVRYERRRMFWDPEANDALRQAARRRFLAKDQYVVEVVCSFLWHGALGFGHVSMGRRFQCWCRKPL